MTWRDELFARRTMGVRLGLDAVREVDEALGRPGSKARAVQILGTNGKGSTAAMLAHGLSRAGLRVGLYTSPHLHRVGERVVVDGSAVSDARIQAATDRVIAAERVADRRLSFFEVLTLAALCEFEEAGCEVLVLEAGLGGRLDATRVRDARVHLMARIGLDHQAYLGPDLASITAEKIAVIRPEVPMFSVAQVPAVEDLMRARAEQLGATLTFVQPIEGSAPLAGDHQRHNAALALAGGRVLHSTLSASDLEGVSWPARLETKPVGRGRVTFDVAHNLDGIARLVDHVRSVDASAPLGPERVVVFGCMADKEPPRLVEMLRGLGRPIWFAAPERDGAMEVSSLVRSGDRAFVGAGDKDLHAAIEDALARGAQVLVCGSHFVVAQLRARLLDIPTDEQDSAELTDPLTRDARGR